MLGLQKGPEKGINMKSKIRKFHKKRNFTRILAPLFIAGLTLALVQIVWGQENIESQSHEMQLNSQIAQGLENATHRPNNITDPNRIEERQLPMGNTRQEAGIVDINDFNELDREINLINIESRTEHHLWLETIDQKTDLAQSTEHTVAAELAFIRKVAVEEKAEKTVKAIDFVLQRRRERLNALVANLQDELRQQRQQELGDRRERRPVRERIERPDREERLEQARERRANMRRTRETRTEDNQE